MFYFSQAYHTTLNGNIIHFYCTITRKKDYFLDKKFSIYCIGQMLKIREYLYREKENITSIVQDGKGTSKNSNVYLDNL